MNSRIALISVACALSLCPQAVHSQEASEPVGAPIERRLRIIVDGAESAAHEPPPGGATQAAAAAPTFQPESVAPFPGTAAPLPPLDTPAPEPAIAPGPAAAQASASSDRAALPAEWVEDALRTPTTAGEGWRIQIGAFRDTVRAEAAIASLEAVAAGPGADPIRQVVPAGDVYRAQMSGFADRAAADGACQRIAATGQACFVVSPP